MIGRQITFALLSVVTVMIVAIQIAPLVVVVIVSFSNSPVFETKVSTAAILPSLGS